MQIRFIALAAGTIAAALSIAACSSSGAPGSAAPTAATTNAAVSGACLLGANGADVEVGIANPTTSCAAWVKNLAGTGLTWSYISQLAAPESAGTADSESMQQVCDLTDGTEELYVEDAGGAIYGNQICSGEEQNGWSPETSPGPLAVQAGQQQQAQASASAAASQASTNAAAEQTASTDMTAVQGIGFSADLAKLGADVTQTNTDLGTVRSDAANGPNGADGDCENLEGTVNSDVEGTIDADMEGSTAADVDAITSDIGTARHEVSTFQGDLSNLQSMGLPAPAGASAAITAAQNAISNAVSTANGDISAVNADVVSAYQAANGIATSTCSGPGNPPSPIQPLS